MIYTKEDIERFNSQMLGRIPSNKPNNGIYNQYDYKICSQYLYGLSSKQIADVCRRLTKYVNIHPELDASRLKNTAIYFQKQSLHEKGIPITAEKRGDFVAISFPFNRRFVPIIKRIENHSFINNNTWLIPADSVFPLLKELEKQGAYIEHTWTYLKRVSRKSKKNIIKVKRIGDYHVAILFPNEIKGVIENSLKQIKRKKYNQKYGIWIIHIDEINDFVGTLDSSVDYSELIPFCNTNESKDKVDGNFIEINFNPRYIRLSFDSENRSIIQAIQKLSFKKFERKNKFWYIHKIELPKLIKELNQLPNVDATPLKRLLPKKLAPISFNPIIYSHLERKPYQHQIEAAKFLLRVKKGILAHEMGGGKTFSSILAAAHLTGPKIVICPATLKLNWQKEIKMVMGDKEKIVIINGSNWQDCGDNGWCIINWDILHRHANKIIDKRFICLIADEAHLARGIKDNGNPSSKRAKMYVRITGYIPYVFALTGTPIMNYTKDIFNQLVVTEHPESIDFRRFAKKYCDAKFNGYGLNVNGSSNEEMLNKELQKVMLRARKDEMLDLPEKIRSFIPVEVNLDKYKQRIENYMKKKFYLSDNKKKLVELNAMKKEVAIEKVKHTINFTKELLAIKEQVVIFTCYKRVVDEIMKEFGDIATKITGDCSLKEKEQAKVDFQNGDKKVIVCNFIAAGVGVTLTRAANLLINDYEYLPANMLQAEDRCHRIGQKRKTHIYYFYTEAAIEKTLVELLSKKIKAISKNIDGREENIYGMLLDSIEREYQTKIAI